MEEERDREKNISVRLLGAVACNPGMCPGWELNLRCFGLQPVFNPLRTAWKQIYDIQNTAAQTQGPRSNGRRRGFRPVVCCLFEGFVLVHCVIIKHDMETRPWTQTLRV
ncbi:hypothetical protein HJG60_009104 [Phyllostomus discolor]|uniref:Uncharacterized protein n=1 Tax=Phyllostomus discolor TaxID=89673 RepID=A0A833YPW6_9CHIR|nr:hypothetical protein HJG60_009104 [Phyllostomus discolor]